MILELGRSPGEWNGYQLQYSYLENPMNRDDSQTTVYDVAELNTTDQLSTHILKNQREVKMSSTWDWIDPLKDQFFCIPLTFFTYIYMLEGMNDLA